MLTERLFKHFKVEKKGKDVQSHNTLQRFNKKKNPAQF